MVLTGRLPEALLPNLVSGELPVGKRSPKEKMNGSCPTLDSLIVLGFEPRQTSAGLDGVCYRFVHLHLDAVHVMNMYVRNGVMLGGVLYAGRTLATVESQIPDDLGTTSEAAAWVSYALSWTLYIRAALGGRIREAVV